MTKKITTISGKRVEGLSRLEKIKLSKQLRLAQSFMERANLRHNRLYDYPSVPETLSMKTKIDVVCRVHGSFKQTVNSHLGGRGCPTCSREGAKKVGTENYNAVTFTGFLKAASEKWGDAFTYREDDYSGMSNEMVVACKRHGEEFQIRPSDHLRSKTGSCPSCVRDNLSGRGLKTKDQVLADFNKIHVNKYDYSAVEYVNNRVKITIRCPKHGGFEQTPVRHLYGDGCPSCGHFSSKAEASLQEWLDQNGVRYLENERKTLGGVELDLYLPDYNLAIEYHGLYWHREQKKPKDYHLNKLNLCREKGISLIQIFENEWLSKRDLVLSMLSQKIGMNNERVFARKCEMREVGHFESKSFLEENHLQGYSPNSHVKIGAYAEGTLVSLMTFGKPSLSGSNKRYEWCLDRFAVKKNHRVAGGFSKLLKHFVSNYKPKSLSTAADLRWSKGDVYLKNGFVLTHQTKPNYWYFKLNNCKVVYHRFNFRKSVLINKLEEFDPGLTEYENMLKNGFDRIWDCGNLMFEYEF